MVTTHYSREHFPRPPHISCPKRLTIRYNFIYYFRGSVLHWILLSFLPLKPSTNTRIRRLLTTNRNSPTKPPRSTPTKHLNPPRLRSIHYLSPSQPNRRGPKTHNPSTIHHHCTRRILHPPPSLRILRSTIHNLRRSVWIHFLCGYRVSRVARNHRIYFPSSMLTTTTKIPLHIQPPLRL